MGYPNGPLLRVLAERVLANLDDIDGRAPKWDPKSPDRDNPPFTDTQLLISTLGFLVFPHERTPDALGDVLLNYNKKHKLSDVMKILYPEDTNKPIEIADEEGEAVTVDPASIKGLPRLLRNSIAHFNVRPIATDGGRFGGVRVWNRDRDGNITLVADIEFDELRKLATFALKEFAGNQNELKGIDDPADPMDEVKKQGKAHKEPKLPRINRDHWNGAIKLTGGNPIKAKAWIDGTLSTALGATKKK